MKNEKSNKKWPDLSEVGAVGGDRDLERALRPRRRHARHRLHVEVLLSPHLHLTAHDVWRRQPAAGDTTAAQLLHGNEPRLGSDRFLQHAHVGGRGGEGMRRGREGEGREGEAGRGEG